MCLLVESGQKDPDHTGPGSLGSGRLKPVLTCDAEAVGSAGVRKDVRWRLVVVEQTLPLGEVVVAEKIQRVCQRGKSGFKNECLTIVFSFLLQKLPRDCCSVSGIIVQLEDSSSVELLETLTRLFVQYLRSNYQSSVLL